MHGGGGGGHSNSGRSAGADTVGTVLIPEENVRDHDDRMSAGGWEITGSGPNRKKKKKKKRWNGSSGEQTTCWRMRTSGESAIEAPDVSQVFSLHAGEKKEKKSS